MRQAGSNTFAARASRAIIGLALLSAAAACAPARAANIEMVPSGSAKMAIFYLSGTIAGGDTIKMQALVAKLPPQMPVGVILDSPGGVLIEGFSLGRFFYNAGISTFVMGSGGACESACALAFLGGYDKQTGRRSRFVTVDGKLGFHQWHRRWSNENPTFTKDEVNDVVRQTRALAAEMIGYLGDLKEDMRKLHLLLKAPGDSMHYVRSEDAALHGFNLMDKDGSVVDVGNLMQRARDR